MEESDETSKTVRLNYDSFLSALNIDGYYTGGVRESKVIGRKWFTHLVSRDLYRDRAIIFKK
jgi:hypothetical protein